MQGQRNNALMELKRLAKNLTKCKLVHSDRPWKEELEEVFIWANNEGTKSSLSEINKRIRDNKLKVRNQVTFFLFSHVFNSAGLLVLL